jgi:hypothetical protein
VQLAASLKRVGAVIVKEKATDTEGTYYLRVDPEQGAKWVDTVSGFLLGQQGKRFTVDISKYFYVAQGEVKYLWRIVLQGDVATGLVLLGASAITAAVAHAPEITSIPLVGRATYEFNPAKGKLKGSHEVDTASSLVAQASAMMGVGGVS